MPPETTQSTAPHSSNRRRPLNLLLGLALLAPAALCCLAGLALPTLQTALLSLQKANLVRASEFVGAANYARLFQDPVFARAANFTLWLMVERVLIVAFVPPILALLVNEFGRAVRVPARLLFSLPLVLFAPVAAALSWRIASNPRGGIAWLAWGMFSKPDQAPMALLAVDALSTFGLACGIGLVVYLLSLRGAGESAPAWKKVWAPLFAAWAVTVLAAMALSLQSFTLSFVLTGGGPVNATTTLALLQYKYAFQVLQFGFGAAVATLQLAALMLLGLAAGVILIGAGMRLETVPPGKPVGLFGGSRRAPAAVLLAPVVLGSLGCVALSALPPAWVGLTALTGEARLPGAGALPVAQIMLNTAMPVGIAVLLVQLPLAYLAALGIGALRPLGRRSEWMLVLFSPWLFVTAGPLSIVAFQRLSGAHLLGTSFALISPLGLCVPMLFVLTLFFKGQEPKWRAACAAGQSAGAAFFRTLILPSLPLALLLACVACAVGQQELLWPMIAATKPQSHTAPVALATLGRQFASTPSSLAAALFTLGLPTFIWTLLAAILFQVFYIDRLALGGGASE